jgi:hypothetical protein
MLGLDEFLFQNVDPEGADFGTGHGMEVSLPWTALQCMLIPPVK